MGYGRPARNRGTGKALISKGSSSFTVTVITRGLAK